MEATSPTSSDSGSAYFRPDSPQIPDHIIVTFDGKVREMLRITRDEEDDDDEQPRRSRKTSRPRYYAGASLSRPTIE